MTFTLELEPEEAELLEARARAKGMDMAQFARMMLGLTMTTARRPTREELEQMFDELGEGSKTRPVLPPEAYDRENLYEDRL